MDIVDIQEVEIDTKITHEVTFADENGYDVMKIILTKDNFIALKNYFVDNLSLAAQRKKKP